MACSQTLNGLVRDCERNAGGIKAVYIANADDVTSVVKSTDGEKIASITMANGKKFKGFYFRRGQASLTLQPQMTEANEYAGEQGTLSLSFGKMDTTKRVQMAALSIAELVVIVLDNNGIYWLLGLDHPVVRSGGESGFGAQTTDYNHYSMELQSNDNGLPFEVEASGAEAVID